MEDQAPKPAAANRTVVILLGVIVVLLVAVVVYLVAGGKDADTPTASNNGNTGSTNTTSTMPGGTETPFDPATATKVASGQTPEEHVGAYFDAVVAGDYETAFEMLPADKKESYGGIDAFAAQLQGYGITAYSIDSTTEEGDETQVLATATMEGGDFQYLWIFVKSGDDWLLKSRTLPGMSQ